MPHLYDVLKLSSHGILFKLKRKSHVLLRLNAAAALATGAHTSRGIHPQCPRLPGGLWVQQNMARGCQVQVRPHVRLTLDIDSSHQACCVAAQAEVAQGAGKEPHSSVPRWARSSAVKILGISTDARMCLR